MLKAIIFDFNGVILDDEPLHFAAMRDSVIRLGIELSRKDYWDKYLPLDDRQCLLAICRDHSVALNERELSGTLALKRKAYRQLLRGELPIFPGADEFIRAAAGHYPLAIVSGARRSEIESTLESTGLRRYFVLILGAEDFLIGKPHPESYLLGLERLNGTMAAVEPGECLVVEDSVAGIQGAKSAGMKCLAVANSYPSEALHSADKVVSSLADVRLNDLRILFEEPV